MSNGPNLRVRISADLKDIKQGLGLLRTELAGVKKQAEQVTPSTSVWSKGLSAIRSQLLGIVSVYGAMRAGGAFVRLADEAANLTSRLRLVTRSQEQFSRAQAETFAIAQRTSSAYSAVGELYVRLAQNSESLANDQDRLLNLTEAVSQALVVSGASVSEANSAIRQFTQAVASGVLRGDEFNSIMENAPRLARALADGLGVPVGALRRMAEAGELTSARVIKAIESQSHVIEKEFGTVPLTVARATQQVRNALLKLVGDADSTEGASKDLAQAIADLARVLESEETKRGFGEFVSGLAAIVEFSTKAAAMVGKLSREVKELSGVSLPKWAQASLMALSGNVAGAVNAYASGRNPRPDFSNVVTGANSSASGGGGGAGGGGDAGKAVVASNALMRDSVSRALAELDRLYKASEIGFREYFATRRQLQEQAIDLEIEQARNELAITKDLGKRRDLEEQIAILMRDRAEAGAAAARDQKAAEDDLTKQLGEVKLALLELDGETGRAARAKLEEEWAETLKKLEAASDEAGKAMVRNLIDRLVAKAQQDQLSEAVQRVTGTLSSQEGSISAQVQAGALGYVEGERRLSDLRRTALAQLRDLRQAQQAYLATLSPDSAEYATAIQALAGIDTELSNIRASMDMLGQGIADAGANALDGFWANLREGSLTGLETVKQLVGEFARGVYDVVTQDFTRSIVGGIRSMVGKLANRGAEASAEAASATAAATIQTTAATTAAATLTAGATTAGAALTAAGTALGAALISSATTAAAIMRTASAFGSFGAAHGGGLVGALQMQRHNINPIVFGAAPRYHGGGQAGLTGLRNKEVAAILEEGETVRTKQQEAALASRLDAAREGGRPLVKQPIVVIGDRAVANAMAGADGEEVTLTHVRNNWDALVNGAR